MVAISPVVSEEKSFEIVDGRRTDDGRRTTEPAYTISTPRAFGSGELIKKVSLCRSGEIIWTTRTHTHTPFAIMNPQTSHAHLGKTFTLCLYNKFKVHHVVPLLQWETIFMTSCSLPLVAKPFRNRVYPYPKSFTLLL